MIGRSIRSYLNVEWQRKLDEKDVSSVPYGWAKDHLGVEHSFEPSTMPGKNAHVPRQDNYCDCGLFVLAYLDFWTHAPPDQVELCEKGAWKGKVLLLLSYRPIVFPALKRQLQHSYFTEQHGTIHFMTGMTYTH